MSHYCTFYIVRHGESEWNVARIMQGQSNLSKLTQIGEKQAQDIAKQFTRIAFNAIFSSDLLRAKRTAEIIALDRQLAIITHKAIRERTFGHMEGKSYEEYTQKFEKLIQERDKLNFEKSRKIKIAPDIESDDEVVSRFITFLRETAVAFSGKNVLIVSHGGPMRLLLMHLSWNDQQKLKPRSISNTGYIKLRSDGVDFFIDAVVGLKS